LEQSTPTELPQPTEEEWKEKGEEFYSLWQFPNCIGVIDGNHIEIQAPNNSGSPFFNCKKTFSVVLLALVDANYKFTIIDIGGYGKSCDRRLFARSTLGKLLETNSFIHSFIHSFILYLYSIDPILVTITSGYRNCQSKVNILRLTLRNTFS
jgi:hypothetical protein